MSKKTKTFSEALKSKGVTGTLAIVALIFGVFLAKDISVITGNVIINPTGDVGRVPLIGILLILCSAILGAYSLIKR